MMASEGRAVNPREEEKELDDKLMELGLLEPGMTLQEKRELTSVVLESTRMAEEQLSQRNAVEHWESMIISSNDEEADDVTSRSESPELIAISVSKPGPGKPSTSSISNQRRREEVKQVQRETVPKGRNRAKKDVQERKGKRERDEDITEKETIVLEEGDGDSEVDEGMKKRDGRFGRRVEVKKDDSSKIWNFSRRKREDDRGKMEGEDERPQKKLLGAEEFQERKGRREVEVMKTRVEDEDNGRRGAEEKGRGKDVGGHQDGVQKGDTPKAKAASDKQPVEAAKTPDFYGPSCSSNVKELNPLRSELHGYSRKRRPPRSSQVSLIQLAKEDVPQKKKALDEAEIEELVLHDDTSQEQSNCDETLVRSIKDKPSTQARDTEDRSLFLEKHLRGRKALREKVKEGESGEDVIDDDDDWETTQGGKIWIKESRKRNGMGGGPVGLGEGPLHILRGNSERTLSLLAGAGKMKRREPDMQAEIEEESEVDDDERGEEESHSSRQSPVSDFILEGKKKRRLAKGVSSKKWVDVVIFPKSSSVNESEENVTELTKPEKKIRLPPNKRWRRVKRKAKSSFGSGSEVDEWISSEEEQKSPGMNLSKEQLIARFDEQLSRLKDALKEEHSKKSSSVSSYSRCKLCEKKSTMKVPPGFQEPDSDDECNLWKICFSKPPSDPSDENLKQSSKNEKAKPDVIPLVYKSAITRSQSKQIGESSSPHSVSKSPAPFEDDMSTSPPVSLPETKDKPPSMDIAPSDESLRWDKSSSTGEVVLFDKVIHSQPCITTGTQTFWEEHQSSSSSSASSSQGDSVASGMKLKEGSQVVKPVWDLLLIDSDGEEIDGNSKQDEVKGGNRQRTKEKYKNVTMRKAPSESPEYLSLKSNDEDTILSPSNVACPKPVGRGSESLLCEPVIVPSPVIPKGSRRGKLRAVEERKGGPSGRKDRVQPSGRKVDAHITEDDDSEEVQELQPLPAKNKVDDLPKAIACPLCNRKFPISEIEAHASGCNQEEEDELPRSLRHGGKSRQREDADPSEAAGASHQRNDVEMVECEEVEDDDDEYEAASSSQQHVPRPAPLATYTPISQQKDSLIDYSDQFPHKSRNVDLQSTLERMRQSLMKRVRKKTRWRKKSRPKWKRKKP